MPVRVTIEAIENEIVAEHYFTALDGLRGSDDVDLLNLPNPTFSSLSTLTFCTLVLKNGYVVTGEAACVDPKSYNEEIGNKVARTKAIEKIWPLMGYELKSILALLNDSKQPETTEVKEEESKLLPHQQRVVTERDELNVKLDALNKFIRENPVFSTLPLEDQNDLMKQFNLMWGYRDILDSRITRF